MEESKGVLGAQSSWWKVHYLERPEVRLQAVQAARLADIIMVSAPAFEVPPRGLQDWADAWLACRAPRKGSLIGLIGVPELPGARSSGLPTYLRAVADRGRLAYIEHERRLPVGQPDSPTTETGNESVERWLGTIL